MKGITTLWTVESGCYSDHRVLAVFDDEQTATAWRDALVSEEGGWNQDAYVGTIEYVASGTTPAKETTWRQDVVLWDNGKTETRGLGSSSEYPIVSHFVRPKRPTVRYVRAPCYKDKGGRLEVVGPTRDSVAKVVSERVAMWKAGAWAGRGHEEIKIGGE